MTVPEESSSASTPILAIDVDGVLNSCDRGPIRTGWDEARVLGYRIRYNITHGPRLLAIAESTGAELAWCTTWENLANRHIAPLVGLPELPVVPLSLGRAGLKFTQQLSIGRTKAKALASWAGDRPFCWLDDEPDAISALASHPVPHLVIRVNEDYGLQDNDFSLAERWLARISQAGKETQVSDDSA